MLYFILLLSTFAFSHNNIGIQLDTGKYINGIYKSQNYDPINIQPCSDLSLINANQLFVSFHTRLFNESILIQGVKKSLLFQIHSKKNPVLIEDWKEKTEDYKNLQINLL